MSGMRRFHFKSPPLKDLAIQRFKEWTEENKGFYGGFRNWLKENGYGGSSLNIYGAAARMAIGYLRKPYWTIDPEADLEIVREHLANSERTLNTQTDYRKGLLKLAEYLRLRCHLPRPQRQIPWAFTIGSLSTELQEQIRAYLQHCQREWKVENQFERSRDSLYGLSKPLRWMAEQSQVKRVAEITPQVWYAWLDDRLAAGLKPVTLNMALTYLRGLVWFVREGGEEVCERFLLVQPLRAGRPMPKDLPLENLRKLQAVIQTQSCSPHAGQRRVGRLDLAWFLLMLHCGLRTCEVRHLKLNDIEWQAKRLRIEQSKGLKDRYIYLDEAVLGALRAYLEVRGQADSLLENVFLYRHAPLSRWYCSHRLQTYGFRCGVRATPHQLRHSCATLLLNAGAPVLSVQRILGHRQIDTTLGYARLYDGTLAADYYAAMNQVEQGLFLPEDSAKEAPRIGELIALADALRGGSLNPAQIEIVRALREGLGFWGDMENVKVLP